MQYHHHDNVDAMTPLLSDIRFSLGLGNTKCSIYML